MQALLSFDRAPPYSVPVRFMLTAPLFGIAAGLLLAILGEDALASRWSTSTLALTHLFTAGFLLQVMLGALLQLMPVAAGANLARPLLLGSIVHAATAAGAVCLVVGFLSERLVFMHAAGALLAAGIGLFLAAAAQALWRVPNTNPTTASIKLALGGLFVTAALGVSLLVAWIGGKPWPLRMMTDLHASWGLLAWCAILLAGVAYVVVPMFQLTPGYTARFSRWFGPVVAVAVLFWSLLRVVEAERAAAFAQCALAALVVALAATTLLLQRRSKRSRTDTTMRYWRLGMGSAIAAALVLFGATLGDREGGWAQVPFLIGALGIGGGLVSVISGMLFKILPFLSWLHLQNRAGPGGKVPHMGEYLPERLMVRQFRAHVAALVLFVLAVFWPEWLARPAGLAIIVAHALLLANILAVVRRYRSVCRALPAR